MNPWRNSSPSSRAGVTPTPIREWTEAHEWLSAADGVEPLGGDDLELLATSAYMLGREDDYLALLERAHAPTSR